MKTVDELVTEIEELLQQEHEIRIEIDKVVWDIATREYSLELFKWTIEKNLIDAAGGEKSIGSNEEARHRVLGLVVGNHRDYADGWDHLQQKNHELQRLKTDLKDVLNRCWLLNRIFGFVTSQTVPIVDDVTS